MKQIIFVTIIILVGLFIYFARPDTVFPANHLIVFSQQHCPHCHHALAFIDNDVKPLYPQLAVDVRDISDKRYRGQLIALMHQKKRNLETVGTPVIVFNDTVLVGWTESNEKALMRALATIQE